MDFIVDPTTYNPSSVKQNGKRLLLLKDIGSASNVDGADAWKGDSNIDLVAGANDIVEWDGTRWHIVFDASETTAITYTTNLNTSVQYRFKNGEWFKSIDGDYPVGSWRIELAG